ncbi:MAG: DedA family protein [Thermoleophilaceae bacterium]
MLPLAVLADTAENAGYPTLALLVGLESMGIPLPGETALIAAAVLAAAGHLDIVPVIAIAAAAAIVGDNIGYMIGRLGGRSLLERPGAFEETRRTALERGDRLFRRHGGKAVFFGRWVSLLRIWAAWIAGATHMPWPRFLFFNAAGGICWAICFGLLGYFGGRAAAELLGKVGVGAALALAAAAAIGYSVVRVRR